MYRLILLFACLLALTGAEITTCDSPVGHVNPADVHVSGCHPNDAQCSLKRGTNVTIEFDFTINKPVRTVKAVVYGYVWLFSSSFDLPDADVCRHSNTTGVHCPLLNTHSKFHYSTSLLISPSYPSLSVSVNMMLQNEDGENIACFYVASKLT